MKRKAIAAVWIAGATTSLLLATVFLFGCCVLPFHHVVHKLMPVCDIAANILRGHQDAHGHEHETVPPSPAREKQEPVKRVATETPEMFRLVATTVVRSLALTATTAYRSYITLGAVRCDRDVGLHVLVETFLI